MTTASNPIGAPIAELARRMAVGELTAESLTAACLARIGEEDGALHAFVEVYADEAIAAARALDGERQAGRVRGPLHGIPVAVKDLADIEGKVTHFGSRVFSDRPAASTAPFVARLIDAGMVVIGKTQMVEFALGSWGSNHGRGTPRNPHDRTVHRVPGGSSSGSGVAVAAGMVPAAIGSDTGGSIRIPASLCGIVGLKPTVGAVPTGGVAALSETFDTIGPMTAWVDDARLVFEALAGVVCPLGEAAPSQITVGIIDHDQMAPIDPEVADTVGDAVTALAKKGLQTIAVRLPLPIAEYQRRCGAIMGYEAYAALGGLAENRTLPMDPFVRGRILAGGVTTWDDCEAARAERIAAKEAFAQAMKAFDFLILPSTPIAATPLEEVDEAVMPMSRLTRLANYLDLCALSLPAGKTVAGLPIGLQIVAKGGCEAELLGFAAWVEKILSSASD